MSVGFAWKSAAKSNEKLANQKHATLFLSWMPFRVNICPWIKLFFGSNPSKISFWIFVRFRLFQNMRTIFIVCQKVTCKLGIFFRFSIFWEMWDYLIFLWNTRKQIYPSSTSVLFTKLADCTHYWFIRNSVKC